MRPNAAERKIRAELLEQGLKICSNQDCEFNGKPQPLSNFNRTEKTNDGLQRWCKSCFARYRQSSKGIDASRRGNRRYMQSEKGKATRAAYAQTLSGKQAIQKGHERYRSTGKRRAALRRYSNSQARASARARYKTEKEVVIRANTAVRNVVRAGRMPHVSTQVCCDCGAVAQVYHHWSYDRSHWLDVIPLCRKCHSARHVSQPVTVIDQELAS